MEPGELKPILTQLRQLVQQIEGLIAQAEAEQLNPSPDAYPPQRLTRQH